MSAERLSLIGGRLVKRYKTRDPFEIAGQLGIEIMFCNDFGPLKGMYRVIKRNRFIFLNNDLSEHMQRIVCAHELGHDQAKPRVEGANGAARSRQVRRLITLHRFGRGGARKAPQEWHNREFFAADR